MDPLAHPEQLVRRVYAYAAYRLGDGPDAEDATSDTFERALRYRRSYDRKKGEPVAWLLGIARRCVDDVFAARPPVSDVDVDSAAPGNLDSDAIRRLSVRDAVQRLDDRSRELVALRYGADLTARQIGELLGERTNTVEVALHRALAKLRSVLADEDAGEEESPGRPAQKLHYTRAL
jgi:RNA polymerase sigma-70 factor (ECF subfamily)